MKPVTELNRDHTSHHCTSADTVWDSFLNGDGQAHQIAREKLFNRHLDLAERMAGKYIRVTPAHKIDPEDLRSSAFEGLLHSLDHFDPAAVVAEASLDVAFRKYASRCIYGLMMDELTRQDTLTKYLREQVRQFRQQAEELAQLMGRCPTGQELREAFGCRNEQRFQLLESLSDYMVNQENLALQDGDEDQQEGEEWNATRAVAAAEGYDPIANTPYAAVVQHLYREQLQRAIEELPPLQQQIIHVRYGEGESLAQMARDIGISRQTLSMHHTRALAHLREALTERGYGPDALPTEWCGC